MALKGIAVVFDVADMNEARRFLDDRGVLGRGRHPISSAHFWYFENPVAATVEYYADAGYCTADWKPGRFERKPEWFAEWAIAGGVDGTTRRQLTAQEKAAAAMPRGPGGAP